MMVRRKSGSIEMSFVLIIALLFVLLVGLFYVNYQQQKEYENELLVQGYIDKDGLRFYPDDTVEVPVERDGKTVWEKAELQQDSNENIYIVNPKNGRYKIYKHGQDNSTMVVMAGKTPVVVPNSSDAPMPWGEEGTLPKGAKISDK